MIADLEQLLARVTSEWEISENSTTLTIQKDTCTSTECGQIIEQVEGLREFIDGRSLIFIIEDSRDIFKYRIQWEPTNNIVSIEDSDAGTNAGDIFADQDEITALQKIRGDRIDDIPALSNSVSAFTKNSQVQVSFKYRIDTEDVAEFISSETETDYRTSFFFRKETFISVLEGVQVKDASEIFAPENGKRIFVIQDLEGYLYGSDLAFFNLNDLNTEKIDEFTDIPPKKDLIKNKVGRECVIDDFESSYFPPSFFEFSRTANENSLIALRRRFVEYKWRTLFLACAM